MTLLTTAGPCGVLASISVLQVRDCLVFVGGGGGYIRKLKLPLNAKLESESLFSASSGIFPIRVAVFSKCMVS